jgi:hypothetical protein
MRKEKALDLWAGMPEIVQEKLDLWAGMPEFVQEKKEPYAKIIFRFENEKDLQEFAALIGQRLTNKTKSSWHPFKPHRTSGPREIYVDEN